MEEDSERWQDAIVGERLDADRAFQERVQASELSHQSWELVMTAVDIELEADEAGNARLVANLDNLDSVLPAIADVEARGSGQIDSGGKGLLGSILGAIGLGGGGNTHRSEAERLANEYADELQELLEERGRWEQLVERELE